MSRFQVSIIAIVIISTIAFISYYQQQQLALDKQLIIGLRCDDGVAGKLSISITANSTVAKDAGDDKIKKRFDVAEICTSRKIKFDDYLGIEDVSFEYTNAQGEVARLVSKGGDDIEVNNGRGYFVVIAIKNTSPYLVNDRI